MHNDNSASNGNEPSAKGPIYLPVVTHLERYVWLAPYVMDLRGALSDKGGVILAQCPAHNDQEYSLSLHPQYGISCRAGCSYEAMLAALHVRGGPRAVQLPAV